MTRAVLMTSSFMACCPPSNRLGIDFIVFFVGSDESDIDGEELVIDPYCKTVLIAANVEHDSAISQNARCTVTCLYCGRRRPLSVPGFRVP